MTANAKIAKDQELRDLIVRKVVDFGSICAPNLVAHLEREISTENLIVELESMVADGVLRHKEDDKDDRKYKEPYQVAYVLAE
ncbi:MAG: hypothetical protein ACJ74J_12305 [Blastocatellia bacterium]